uniref:DUF423 domain-containing protein n=1 Tax=Paramoeba aestuarina TaxID=180227 RepID=A0A7S4K1G6_9EUKA|mmetsp:Transcript_14765/g.23074  ORF Transcript_14765/g.23074 Transcript_14765/m.23074 type:complete len:127 (+) Transcript_14765:97-477(+)
MNWLLVGSLCGGWAVALGSFGAHGLKKTASPEQLHTFEVGCRYQMYHAFAMITCHFAKISANSVANRQNIDRAGYSFLFGTLLFSGSLYLLVMTGIKKLGAITPIGGTAFLIGWGFLSYAALKSED